mmetsp:Transcript_10517/g.24865  ORF Transcript_10517/g.24865 Transcript_10517/m.24865 type:complete len:532 (+) Transcript_10517:69-1664(+)
MSLEKGKNAAPKPPDSPKTGTSLRACRRRVNTLWKIRQRSGAPPALLLVLPHAEPRPAEGVVPGRGREEGEGHEEQEARRGGLAPPPPRPLGAPPEGARRLRANPRHRPEPKLGLEGLEGPGGRARGGPHGGRRAVGAAERPEGAARPEGRRRAAHERQQRGEDVAGGGEHERGHEVHRVELPVGRGARRAEPGRHGAGGEQRPGNEPRGRGRGPPHRPLRAAPLVAEQRLLRAPRRGVPNRAWAGEAPNGVLQNPLGRQQGQREADEQQAREEPAHGILCRGSHIVVPEERLEVALGEAPREDHAVDERRLLQNHAARHPGNAHEDEVPDSAPEEAPAEGGLLGPRASAVGAGVVHLRPQGDDVVLEGERQQEAWEHKQHVLGVVDRLPGGALLLRGEPRRRRGAPGREARGGHGSQEGCHRGGHPGGRVPVGAEAPPIAVRERQRGRARNADVHRAPQPQPSARGLGQEGGEEAAPVVCERVLQHHEIDRGGEPAGGPHRRLGDPPCRGAEGALHRLGEVRGAVPGALP